MELELLSAAKLAKVCQLQRDIAKQFTDLRQCSMIFQKSFMDAWMAIEHGNMRRLKESIEMMKKSPDVGDNDGDYLNVCYLQSMIAVRRGVPVVYYMTLLAHAAVMRQKEMVKMLTTIDKGADIQKGNRMTGTPLAQALIHCVHHNLPEVLDTEIVQQLIDPSTINVIYYYHIPADPAAGIPWVCTQLEFSLLLQRMDIVELLLNNGADLFLKPIYNTPSLLFEYFELGTSSLLSWLFDHYLCLDEIPDFINKVLEADILQPTIVDVFNEWVHRHPVHAFLTCGNEEIARKLLHHYSGRNLLAIREPTGRTALQVATDQGNLQAVKVLVKLMADYPESSKDMAQALLAAARHNRVDIVRYLLQKSPKILQVEVAEGVELWKQAITEGLPNVYEVMRDFDQTLVLGLFDDEHNTLGHRAAILGNSELFKVIFSLKSLGNNIGIQNSGMFTALTMKNQAGLTPIQVAIRADQLGILKILQEYATKTNYVNGSESCIEKIEWKNFWEEWKAKLLPYACAYGTVGAVKLLTDMGCEPDTCFNGNTPLSTAAKYGRVETVHYLLHSCKVNSSVDSTYNSKPKNQSSPLLLAAEYGHTRCVIILLEKGANVNERCPKTGYNCLMKAIEKKQRDTALAILIQDSSSLHFSVGKKTPMRMLIEHLPDVAEWVLNKCALEEIDDGDIVDFIDFNVDSETSEGKATKQELQHDEAGQKIKKFVAEHKFELLEDFQSSATLTLPSQQNTATCSQLEMQRLEPHCTSSNSDGENWKQQCYCSKIHPIKLMVKFNQENLLTHPLVESWIQFKWYRVAIPGIIAYFSMYIAFLVFLTLFAVLIPRPGPRSMLCSINNSISVNGDQNNSSVDSYSCEGLRTSVSLYLYVSAVILIIFAVIYLILEVTQGLRRREKYLKEYENYLQVVTFLLVIIFVFPVGHECWCYPSWRWQIGALAVFLAWFNSLTLLKDLPLFGQPVTMLFNVYLNFIKLIYLPILLLLTFSFPFYMLLVRDISAYEGEDAPGFLVIFASPIIAVWSVILQTVDGLEARTIFDESQLMYPVLSYALFIIFIIAMPLLFNNFLTGMAVGETAEERDKAAVTLIKNKINYIFEIENTLSLCLRKFGSITHDNVPELKLDDRQRIMLRNECEELKNKIKSTNRILNIKWDIKRIAGQVEQYQAEVKQMELKTKEELNALHDLFQKELKDIKSLILEKQHHIH